MPHTRHYSPPATACEKPKPPAPPPLPPAPPPPPPPPNTRAWFFLQDPFVWDYNYCRLGDTLAEAEACQLYLCNTIFNFGGTLTFYDCASSTATQIWYDASPSCLELSRSNIAWPPGEACDTCAYPPPPCP